MALTARGQAWRGRLDLEAIRARERRGVLRGPGTMTRKALRRAWVAARALSTEGGAGTAAAAKVCIGCP